MDAEGAAAAVEQDLEIATGLSGFDDAESVFLAGNGEVEGVVACDLQDHSVVTAALVSLSGRMQESRAKAEACSGTGSLQNASSYYS